MRTRRPTCTATSSPLPRRCCGSSTGSTSTTHAGQWSPPGTKLLGLVKHVASVEAGYLGQTFTRPLDTPFPWFEEGAEPNADMWAAPDETREQIVGLYHRVWAHSDNTIDSLPLTAVGQVPWWPPERRQVTLHRILVHMIAETHRHAGHADIIRELVDGAAGLRADNSNMPPGDHAWWKNYRDRVQRAAETPAAADKVLSSTAKTFFDGMSASGSSSEHLLATQQGLQ